MVALPDFFQFDWRTFLTAAEVWLQGGNPYDRLGPDSLLGVYAYPPTALTWMAPLIPLGIPGYYLWTALNVLGWWWLARVDGQRLPWTLLLWPPLLIHLIMGQSTLAIVLVAWAATRAKRRGFGWGLALAWAMTKPQVAFLPVLWLLWQDRHAATRWRLWLGLFAGTVLLALPPTLLNPGIWSDWLMSLTSYQNRLVQKAAWQSWSVVLLALAAYLWYRSKQGGWQWWLTAALVPYTGSYSLVVLLPAIRPKLSYWTLAGITLALFTAGPIRESTLSWILTSQILAVWLINGGLEAQAKARHQPLGTPNPVV